jgi:type I restriction enzyme, S subunit
MNSIVRQKNDSHSQMALSTPLEDEKRKPEVQEGPRIVVRFDEVAHKVDVNVDRETCGLDKYVAGEHMKTDDFHLKEWGIIGDDYLGPAFHKKFTAGQILYGSRRTYLRKIAIPHFDGICANTTFVIEPTGKGLLPELVPFIMQSTAFTNHSIRESKGSTNPYINWKDIAKYEFLIPADTGKQYKIYKILQAAEDGLVKSEQMLEYLKIYMQIQMRELMVEDIDNADHRTADRPGQISKRWDISKLDTQVEIIDCKHITPKYVSNGIPIIRPRNVSQGYIDFSDTEFVSEGDYTTLTDKHIPRYGDIVYSRNASFGIPAFVDTYKKFCIGQDMVIMARKSANTKYIYYVLKSNIILKQLKMRSVGSTFNRINLEDIRNLIIPVPSPAEQKIIADILTSLDIIAADAKRNIAMNQLLKMHLIDHFFPGDVPT